MGDRLGQCKTQTVTNPDQLKNVTQDFCENVADGTWTPNTPPVDGGGGGGGGFCAVRTILARALAENLMQLGASYDLTYQFRDDLLYTSRTGRRFVEHYYRHAEELYVIVVSDPKLLGSCILLWGTLHPFLRQMLTSLDTPPDALQARLRKMRLTKKHLALIDGVIRDFLASKPSPALAEALREFQNTAREFASLTPREVVDRLRS
ncbi:MAG: hypothetical protein IT355_20840 [Gemmatimonadaceae bacterium]|nr:hypothetical protein [Gemmatimonadaceae bacterium]